jgi:hypothetical protein
MVGLGVYENRTSATAATLAPIVASVFGDQESSPLQPTAAKHKRITTDNNLGMQLTSLIILTTSKR